MPRVLSDCHKDCPAKPGHRTILPGTMCSIPTVVIIYKLVLRLLSFICLLCISCFPKELLDLARLPAWFPLTKAQYLVFLLLFLLGNSFADGCLLLSSANLKLFLVSLLLLPNCSSLQLSRNLQSTLFSFWLSNFAAIVFNTLLCRHMHLSSS